MGFKYIVSLQVKHPDANPPDIIAGIGLPASHAWTVGEERATPKGTTLPGTRSESYCAFRLGDGSDGKLADFLRNALTELEHAAKFISELRRTGGRLSFFVSWSPGHPGEVFDVDLLARMARLGIDLGIDP